MNVRITDFSVSTPDGRPLLDRVQLTLEPGTITALTGPSGSGKTTLLRAILGDLAPGLRRTGGTVAVLGQNIFTMTPRQRQRFRRTHLAYVGQDPGSALNPTMRAGTLLSEAAGSGDRDLLVSTLDTVGLAPEHLRRRPGELSGGQQRRLALARALIRRPDILLVDEPLAGLDTHLRKQITTLLRRLAGRDDVTIVVSGHDMRALTDLADQAVTLGNRTSAAAPADHQPATETASASPTLLRGSALCATVRNGRTVLLRDIALTVPAGGSTAIIGASGAGKTTLARVLAGLHAERTGELHLDNTVLAVHAHRRSREQRRRIQLIPQNPLSTLNPRRTVGATIARPLTLHQRAAKSALTDRVAELLGDVGLPAHLAGHYPHELSGGQRQRVAIARALAAGPDLLICDEITSALDFDTAAAIMDLLRTTQATRGLTLIVISHDLHLVRRHCDHIIVLHAGKIAETGPTGAIFGAPTHPVTIGLLDDQLPAPADQ